VAVLCLFALPIIGFIRARKLEMADIMAARRGCDRNDHGNHELSLA